MILIRAKKYSKRFFVDNMHHKTYNDLYGAPNQVEIKAPFDPANYESEYKKQIENIADRIK